MRPEGGTHSDLPGTMKLLAIFFLVLSLGTNIWVALDADLMRDTCTRLRDEVTASLVFNLLTFVLAACCAWACGRFVLIAVSALATVSLSRVPLFVQDVKTICAADIAKAPVGDILKDVTVLDRAQFLSWAALIFFAVGLLAAHMSPSLFDCFDVDEYFHRRSSVRAQYKKQYERPCDDDVFYNSRHSREKDRRSKSTWIRIS